MAKPKGKKNKFLTGEAPPAPPKKRPITEVPPHSPVARVDVSAKVPKELVELHQRIARIRSELQSTQRTLAKPSWPVSAAFPAKPKAELEAMPPVVRQYRHDPRIVRHRTIKHAKLSPKQHIAHVKKPKKVTKKALKEWEQALKDGRKKLRKRQAGAKASKRHRAKKGRKR